MEATSASSSSAVATVSTAASSPSASSSGSSPKPIGLWPGMYHGHVTPALWETRSMIFHQLQDPPKDAPPQRELLVKTPSQSRTSLLYSFSDDFTLREHYRDSRNEVRIGKLLEDLDALAGTISFKHCYDGDSTTRPILLVTASVDDIVLQQPISTDTDLKTVGSVVWVGRSSLEVQLEVFQLVRGNSNKSNPTAVLTANFVFVARDSKTGKAVPVNRLSPETEREKSLFQEAEARNDFRKSERGRDRRQVKNGVGNGGSMVSQGTSLETSVVGQIEHRNIHGRVFGGFLMHRAFELAYLTAFEYAGVVPRFLKADHIEFLKPVDAGDFMRFKSRVLGQPDRRLIDVEVVTRVTKPGLRSREVSNTFNFTFSVHPEAK